VSLKRIGESVAVSTLCHFALDGALRLASGFYFERV